MAKKLFLIGIGGTGMRCLEAFVHCCAMGLYDDSEVELLALDTDRDNGNFRRLGELVDAYNAAKGVDKEHYTLKNTFFSAKINFTQYSPDYSRQETSNFARLFKYGDLRRAATNEQGSQAALADLLFTRRTREFDLKHGYRAQTSLGSLLMYHGILNEVSTNNNSPISRYISKLMQANTQGGKIKVFVLGSVFGGTGASSIPVIPKAFSKAVSILSPGATLENVYYGAVLLTSYFTFKNPSKDYLDAQKVVATADKFALNSQAAMMFYNEDSTVKKNYQKFFMLGTPAMDHQTDHGEVETITGGERQTNKSHYIELFAAFAAYSFFNSPDEELERIRKSYDGVEYYYRTTDESGELFFEDFVPAADLDKFAKGLGLLTALSFLNYEDDFFVKVQSGNLAKDYNVFGYDKIDMREVNGINRYFELFHFKVDSKGKVEDGWLRQLNSSTNGRFVLKPDVFSCSAPRDFEKFKYNKLIYKDDFKKNYYDVGFTSNRYDVFRTKFQSIPEPTDITNWCEKLIKCVYNAMSSLYKFDSK